MTRFTAVLVLAAALSPAPAWAAGGVEGVRDAVAQAGGSGVAALDTPSVWETAYEDRAGENPAGTALDITRVVVGTAEDGALTLRASLAGAPSLDPDDFLALFLDTDRRRTTGDLAAAGAEHAVAWDGQTGRVHLLAWRTGAWSVVPALALAASWAGGPAMRLDPGAIGGAIAFDFWLGATRGARVDAAPDAGTWSFAAPGTAPPAPDTTAPTVAAVRSAGRGGRTVALRYRVADDSGETRERIRILRGRRVVATLETALYPSEAHLVSWFGWKAPRRLHGRLTFCVEASDRAGNRSRPSCALLVLR